MFTRSEDLLEERLVVVLCFIKDMFWKELEKEVDEDAFSTAVLYAMKRLEKQIPGISRMSLPDPKRIVMAHGEGLFKSGCSGETRFITIHPTAGNKIHHILERLGATEGMLKPLNEILVDAKKIYDAETLKSRCN